jgi:hypothetical protein
MNRNSTKAAAEAALRELPSVLGAYVSEDMEGHPREVHLLIEKGPDVADLAREVHGLLEKRLGIPVDRRVISIAQLARDLESGAAADDADGQATDTWGSGRPIFAGLESTTTSSHVRVGVRLEWRGDKSTGYGEGVDTSSGRARAAAEATLCSAVQAPWTDGLGLELEFASIVQALDGNYVLVSALAVADYLGRRPLTLVGAHPVAGDVESAAVLATLKAVNRTLAPALRRHHGRG